MSVYDHTPERTWRHLDSCQFITFLHARPPRVDCKKHGVRQVRLPWTEEKARFTALFERLAIDVLRAYDILSAARILLISWDEAWHIMDRAVRHFKQWYFWATQLRLKPVIEKARMFRKYLTQILTYLRHRITNAVSEGLISKIETVRKKAYGFRNREHFITAIYFHCGVLNLYPVTHKKVG